MLQWLVRHCRSHPTVTSHLDPCSLSLATWSSFVPTTCQSLCSCYFLHLEQSPSNITNNHSLICFGSISNITLSITGQRYLKWPLCFNSNPHPILGSPFPSSLLYFSLQHSYHLILYILLLYFVYFLFLLECNLHSRLIHYSPKA